MKELAEIKPCPFCGEDAEMKESRYCRPIEGWLDYVIKCKGCGCEMLGETINPYREKSEKAKKSVIAKWNKRVKEGDGNDEYKMLDVENNVKVAVKKLREAYWSNDTERYAQQFVHAEAIIISSICHHGYTVVKEGDEE